TLISAQSEWTTCIYCYQPYQATQWSFAKEYRCPDHLCQVEDELVRPCSGCSAGLAFWAKVLHLFLRMYQGDFVTHIETQTREDLRVTRTIHGWKTNSIEHTVQVIRYIDVAIHEY